MLGVQDVRVSTCVTIYVVYAASSGQLLPLLILNMETIEFVLRLDDWPSSL